MSVALAVISHSGIVVASEGRVVRNGSVVSDCFDKTFQGLDGKVLGAHTGLLCFSGMSVGEHINQIIKSEYADKTSLEELVDLLLNPFAKRMENIKPNEVGFQHRTIDILLADRHTIYAIRFEPKDGKIFYRAPKEYSHPGARAVCGDCKAQSAALGVITARRKQIPSMRDKSLTKLAQRAIQKGIANAGSSRQNQDICSCGGRIRHRYIR